MPAVTVRQIGNWCITGDRNWGPGTIQGGTGTFEIRYQAKNYASARSQSCLATRNSDIDRANENCLLRCENNRDCGSAMIPSQIRKRAVNRRRRRTKEPGNTTILLTKHGESGVIYECRNLADAMQSLAKVSYRSYRSRGFGGQSLQTP